LITGRVINLLTVETKWIRSFQSGTSCAPHASQSGINSSLLFNRTVYLVIRSLRRS